LHCMLFANLTLAGNDKGVLCQLRKCIAVDDQISFQNAKGYIFTCLIISFS